MLESRFKKNEEFARRYTSVIQEYIELGHAQLVNPAELENRDGRLWYLPNYGVINPLKPSKVRVVFDASAEFQGHSLNKLLWKGPDLLASLLKSIVLFRVGRIPISADVEKMYHQGPYSEPGPNPMLRANPTINALNESRFALDLI